MDSKEWVRRGIRRGRMGWMTAAFAAAWLLSGLPACATSPIVATGSGSNLNVSFGNGSSVGAILAQVVNVGLGLVIAIAAPWFLFHLYKSIMGYMTKTHQAQKREEAKSHLVHTIVAGILLAAAIPIAAAVINFGGQF